MSNFTSDQLDFLMGGLHKVQMANVSTIILNLEDINLASNAIQIFGASASQGALPVQPIMPFNSIYGASLYTVYGASNAGVIKSSVGTIYSLKAMNISAVTTRFIQLHDSATVVASGAVPVRSFKVPLVAAVGGEAGEVRVGTEIFTEVGENYPLGVVYTWSTTPNSFTPASGSDHNLEIRLK